MSLEKLFEEVESELTWRKNEIRFFRNQLTNLKRESDRRRYRKSMVVMLYSHFEGFTKAAFRAYVDEINRQELKIERLNFQLQAAALVSDFRAFSDPRRKSDIFRKKASDDGKLHRIFRQAELMESLDGIRNSTAEIPGEDVVDTESNLSFIVLKKILYRLGMEPGTLGDLKGTLSKLLSYRNSIAHGVFISGVDADDYTDLESDIFSAMDEIRRLIYKAARERNFERTPVSSLSNEYPSPFDCRPRREHTRHGGFDTVGPDQRSSNGKEEVSARRNPFQR